MSDAKLPQRKKQMKRRRKNLNTNLLQVVTQLEPANIQGVLLGTAVWVCTDDATVCLLDALCFGNLDGGEGTANYVRQLLAPVSPTPHDAQDGQGADRSVQGQGQAEVPAGEQMEVEHSISKDAVDRSRHDVLTPAVTSQQLPPEASSQPPAIPQQAQHEPETPAEQQGQQHAIRGDGSEGSSQRAQHEQRARPGPAGAAEGRGVGGSSSSSKAVRLSLEESFFMAYVLQVLQVYQPSSSHSGRVGSGAEGQGVPPRTLLDDQALWRELQRARPDFLLQYLAYHHFRSKGWIPRTGLQYGADMVLYQKHPALMHSHYSVLILPRSATWRPLPSWHDVQVLNRLTGQVSKKLLLLYVEEAGGAGGGDYTSPNCLARFSVQERMVRRWVPDSHRPA